MRRLRLALLAFAMAIPGSVCPENPKVAADTAIGKAGKEVHFRWAFGAVVGNEGERRFVSIGRDTTLQTGDAFKMRVELHSACYVYVIYRSSGGEWSLLFPDGLGQFEADYEESKPYYIPKGDAWFELDEQIGHETFYVLASSDRLKDLEALFAAYESAESAGRSERASEIRAKIRALRRAHRKLTASAERPVAIAGNVRATRKAEDMRRLDAISVEISAANFYSKAFTIEHR